MKTILVPLDGSALAEQVLPHVRMLADLLDAQVRLLRVLAEQEVEYLVPDYVVQQEVSADHHAAPPHHSAIGGELWRGAEAYLEGQALRLRGYGLAVDTVVQCGPVAELIAAYAEGPNTLIAMATHGRSGLRRWALGSVADKVLHSATCPIFLVRGSAQTAAQPPVLRRVLVPLDGSNLAARALEPALGLCRLAAAELVLFQAVMPHIQQHSDPYLLAFNDELDRRDLAARDLTVLAERLQAAGVAVRTSATVGYPPDEIVDEAARQSADLIVMATHGRSGLRRWALGSVADKVLHSATTPLLLVRASV